MAYSLPGTEDPIRKKIYRSFRGQPSEKEREQGRDELKAKLASFPYRGQAVPDLADRLGRYDRRSTTSSNSPASMPGRLTRDLGSGSCRSP